MNNKSKKILIGIMAIMMQTSIGTSIFAASPIKNYPQMQKYEDDAPPSDRGEDERHRHGDERRHREEERHHQEEEENRRHNEAMRRHPHEDEQDWHERQRIENERHENTMRRIAHDFLNIILDNN